MERTQQEKNAIIDKAVALAKDLKATKFANNPWSWAIYAAAETYCPEDVNFHSFKHALALEMRRRYVNKININKALASRKGEQA
jgi:hypothetical protein